MILAQRTFNHKDQIAFSLLSGDYNPIHVDPIESRKLLSGKCIAHGVNVLLWSLDIFIKKTNLFSKEIKIDFIKPLNVGENITLHWIKNKNVLNIKSKTEIIITISFGFLSEKCSYLKNQNVIFKKQTSEKPLVKNINNLKIEQVFKSFFSGSNKNFKFFFPSLVNKVGNNIVYEIINLSSMVGMQVPGLNSILSSLKINFDHDDNNNIRLKINYIDKRFKLIDLVYFGANIQTNIKAFFRNPPVTLPQSKTIKIKTKKKFFYKKKILIIGGTRGLGAWTAKLSALMGADVSITYNVGENDAKLIQSDIKSTGGICEIYKVEIKKNGSLNLPDKNFNHLYYFASPKIFNQKNIKFDRNLYEMFEFFYCQTFEKIALEFIKRGVEKIFYPSTIAIQQPIIGIEEYIKAKKKGEKICKKISSKYNTSIIYPRIDRILTDQTNSILNSKTENTSKIIQKFIYDMNH